MGLFGRKGKREAKDPVKEAKEYYLKDNCLLSELTLEIAGFPKAGINEFFQNWSQEAAIEGAIKGGSSGRTGHERPDENEGRDPRAEADETERRNSLEEQAKRVYLTSRYRISDDILRGIGYYSRKISELWENWDREKAGLPSIPACKRKT